MNNNQQAAMGALAGMLVCLAIVFVVILIIYIFFLLTLQRTQSEVSERNRELAPGMVWLTLIPLFSTFWVLFMVPKLSNSLRNEFRARGWYTDSEGFGRTTGMIWAYGGLISFALSMVQNAMQFGGLVQESMIVSFLSIPIGLTVFVCWIIYWVQMAGYGKTLRSRGSSRYDDDEQADYDDHYRPRRGDDDDRRDDDEDDYERRTR